MTLPAKKPARAAVARLGLGRLLYTFWHEPRGWIERSWKEGGPLQQRIDRKHRDLMIEASRRLPPTARATADAPEVCFLTGKKYWYQTAFCAWSLQRFTVAPLRITIYDDGSFDEALCAEAERVFPGCRIVRAAEANAALDDALPAARFPALRQQRESYIHLRKLTDLHAGRRGWRLVLDSDMLFFRRPDALLEWLSAPTKPIHMLDIGDAYGYPVSALQELLDAPLASHVNVGICGLRSDALDWDRIEHWCAALLAKHGTSYYLEQALVAMILSGQNALRLPVEDYRLLPDDAECRRPTAALHHYVAEAKRGYFRHAWYHVKNSA